MDTGAEQQVQSRQRVADHGEVFTAQREVNAMLDLVKAETCRIESRFLEPACGTGNFVVEILRRKLEVVRRKYKRSRPDYEKYALLAVSSIYGVDILQDNVEVCRERLFALWDAEYRAVCRRDVNEDCHRSVRFILERNIAWGNALSMKRVDSNGQDTNEPIVFSEWAFVMQNESFLKRTDYTFARLLEGPQPGRDIFSEDGRESKAKQRSLPGMKPVQLSLDGFASKPAAKQPSDEGDFLREYVCHYLKVWENER